MHPQLPPITIGGIVLKESDDLVILGVTFDSKMNQASSTFEPSIFAWFLEQLLKDLLS